MRTVKSVWAIWLICSKTRIIFSLRPTMLAKPYFSATMDLRFLTWKVSLCFSRPCLTLRRSSFGSKGLAR